MIEISRRVRDISDTKEFRLGIESFSIDSFRERHAWVLLGEPGAGKTTVLRQEKETLAEEGAYISIAAFIESDIEQWRDKTLFLDSLDEIQDPIQLIEKIKTRLMRLGNPPFRLACRAANWHGWAKESLVQLCPDNNLTLLELLPLSDNDVLQLLKELCKEPEEDPEYFIQQAKTFGISDLLKNPEMLHLMVKAVQGGKWPTSRKEVYRLACERLAYENNPRHRSRHRENPIRTENILQSTGYLCSILLLADKQGIALDEPSSDNQFITLDSCEPENPQMAALAIQEKLFISFGEGQVIPSHRSVAEYLSSYWLCEQITRKGLSINRLKQLILDADGHIKPSLWGLCGWLVQHNPEMRSWIVAADPLAALYYGDIQYWQVKDKIAVFEALIETPLYSTPSTLMHTFSALALSELTEKFKLILSDRNRFTAAQRQYVLMILNAPDKGMPGFDAEIKKLLNEQTNGLLEDNTIDLALIYLYPKYLNIDGLFKYLEQIYACDKRFFSNYRAFLSEHIVHKTSKLELPLLAEKLFNFLSNPEWRDLTVYFHTLLSILLLEVINTCDLDMPIEQLFSFLKLRRFLDYFGKRDSVGQKIDQWMAQHPERYRDLMDFLFDRVKQATDNWFKDINYLTYITPPADMEFWYFEKAATLDKVQLSEYCLTQAVSLLYRTHPGNLIFIKQKLDEWALSYPDKKRWLQSKYDGILKRYQNDDDNTALRVPEAIQTELMKQFSAIQDGNAPPGVMGYLANIWQEISDNQNIERKNHFQRRFGVDGFSLYQATKEGFKQCLHREDLPTALEIINFYNKGKVYSLDFPCLIGMDLVWKETPSKINTLSESAVASVIAFYLCGHDAVPDWLSKLSLSHLNVLIDVMIRFSKRTKKLGSPEFPINAGFYQLLSNTNIVQETVLELLQVFPLRATKAQLGYLDRLLHSAFKQLLPGLEVVIQHKISLKGIDAAQKVYWYAAATLVSPSDYAPLLLKYVRKSSARILSLARFVDVNLSSIIALYPLPPKVIADIIELFTPHYEIFLSANYNNFLIERLIEELKKMPTEEAGSALFHLCHAEATEKIHLSLNRAYQAQQYQRQNIFLTASAVANILRQSVPINAHDLWALALDKLDAVINDIEKGNTNAYQFYWNILDKKTGTRSPKDEDIGRNHLLERLRAAFNVMPGISCEPEADHHDHKRIDIVVSYQNYKTPIEIKCDFNEKLWTGLRDQLINQYVTSADSNGYGIYVIFWFNDKRKRPCTPGDGGRKAETPQELEERFRQQLTSEEQQRIAIRVIDVSWPVKK